MVFDGFGCSWKIQNSSASRSETVAAQRENACLVCGAEYGLDVPDKFTRVGAGLQLKQPVHAA